MTHRTVHSSSEQQTIQLAQQVAQQARILAQTQPAILIGLQGNLGAGKSVFARAFIRYLMGDESLQVPSPTFTLVQYYDSDIGMIYHYDLYRLQDAEEIYEIGWEESLSEGISLIEWPQRLMGMKPAQMLDISIDSAENESDRTFTLSDSLLS